MFLDAFEKEKGYLSNTKHTHIIIESISNGSLYYTGRLVKRESM